MQGSVLIFKSNFAYFTSILHKLKKNPYTGAGISGILGIVEICRDYVFSDSFGFPFFGYPQIPANLKYFEVI